MLWRPSDRPRLGAAILSHLLHRVLWLQRTALWLPWLRSLLLTFLNQLRRHHLEGWKDIRGIFGGGLDKGNAELLRLFPCLVRGNLAFRFEVALVPNEDLAGAFVD